MQDELRTLVELADEISRFEGYLEDPVAMEASGCREECHQAIRDWVKEAKEFLEKYPNHCPYCGGSGEVSWQENQAPLASGHVWLETLTDLCDYCEGREICALCGQKTVTYDGVRTCNCPRDVCAPYVPECHCWHYREKEYFNEYTRKWEEEYG